jgi:hypothetical protein
VAVITVNPWWPSFIEAVLSITGSSSTTRTLLPRAPVGTLSSGAVAGRSESWQARRRGPSKALQRRPGLALPKREAIARIRSILKLAELSLTIASHPAGVLTIGPSPVIPPVTCREETSGNPWAFAPLASIMRFRIARRGVFRQPKEKHASAQ